MTIDPPAGFTPVYPDRLKFQPWNPSQPGPEDVLEGTLDMALAVAWTSEDRHDATGYWTCQPAVMRLAQSFDETLHLVRGHVSYRVGDAEPIHLYPGDSIVLYADEEATFEVHEPSMTFWAIFGSQPLDLGLGNND